MSYQTLINTKPLISNKYKTNEIYSVTINNKPLHQPYHVFSKYEMHIMIRIIEALQKDDSSSEIKLSPKSLLPKGNEDYDIVEKTLENIQKKIVVIQGKDELGRYEEYIGLISIFRYYIDNTLVEIEINKKLVPQYLLIGKNYSKYLSKILDQCKKETLLD